MQPYNLEQSQTIVNIAQRSFDQVAQSKFALLSGDHNPIHLNTKFARRTQVGDVIVHGVNILLWALDAAVCSERLDQRIGFLDVRFLKPLYLNELAVASIVTHAAALELRVSVHGMTIMEVLFHERSQERNGSSIGDTRYPVSTSLVPLDRADEDLADCKGRVNLVPAAACAEILPAICNQIGAERVAALLGITRIVGMECPGLYSMLVGIKVTFEQADEVNAMDYSVATYDKRFRSARIVMAGGGLRASVVAFNRPRPVKQASIGELAARIPHDVFSGQHALIVGGSRGLGEITAKTVVAGGGTATITYASSRTEAENISEEIADWGGDCSLIPYDVRRPAAEQISTIAKQITHVYYFATPRIFRRNTAVSQE